MLPEALAPLAAWPQFVTYKLAWNEDRKKWDKIPHSPHGYRASTTSPRDWGTYDQAYNAWQASGGELAGVGFVFTAEDPFWFLDIDGALQNGQWSQLAQELCARTAGAAVEVSHSGTGLHIIGSGAVPEGHGNRNTPLHLEFYSKERFVALTGTHARGSAAADLSAAVPGIVEQFFTRAVGAISDEWTTEPVPEWSGPEDDGELLVRALRSGQQTAASAFGGTSGQPTFADLFEARADVLAARWPGNGRAPYDASAADQSFANLLAFWTGRNCDRIERMMRLSALARPKWDQHATYLQNTILKAVGLVQKVYSQPQPANSASAAPAPSSEAVEAAGLGVRAGGGIMLYQQQLEHFAGCVYIRSVNKVLTAEGRLLDQARFNVEFGGHRFVNTTDSKTTGSAWIAFTENENFKPTFADRLCFRPEHGSGGLIVEAGRVLANTYFAIETDRTEGDPGKFLDLVQRQIPDEGDRESLLSYMASVVRNPGLKAQWWPVLQGLKGNGKTVYLTVMEFCVGSEYSHLPNTGKMIRNGMNFNGWIDSKLFLGLEEVKAANRREFFEEFKTTVTNRRQAIEGKGIEETTGDNRANGIMTTNHKDGVPIEPDERRYGVYFMRQQMPGDLQRDGLTAPYFVDLHAWMRGTDAYAEHGPNYGLRVINHYLRTRPIAAELDPAKLAIWAPMTTSTMEAIGAGRGRVEQEVLEAIEEGRQGFAGGWVSSIFLDRLLLTLRAPVARNKRRELMQSIGYDVHPCLPDGRVQSVIQPDNGKPRLYVRKGHLSANVTSPAEVARLYTKAQGDGGTAAAFAS